jgi:hypothetical protein
MTSKPDVQETLRKLAYFEPDRRGGQAALQ